MSRIFITGSSDGLGQLAAIKLLESGHQVVLHARNQQRAEQALNQVPNAENVLIGDFSDMQQTKDLAEQVNELGSFDVVIHNAGIYSASGKELLTVNTLAPYILTCLVKRPKRLIYLSSGMHTGGNLDLSKLEKGQVTYSDSKLHDLILAKAVARKWPDVFSNVVDPGWVPTKMGGSAASDDLQKGYETQVWLAVSPDAKISGRYFYHLKEGRSLKEADDPFVQEKLLEKCRQLSGIPFPET